jgi:hypothetical protein
MQDSRLASLLQDYERLITRLQAPVAPAEVDDIRKEAVAKRVRAEEYFQSAP